MKNTKIIVLFLFQIFSVISVYGSINTYKNGVWQLSVNDETGNFAISNKKKFLLTENSGQFCINLDTVSFSECAPFDISIIEEENKFIAVPLKVENNV